MRKKNEFIYNRTDMKNLAIIIVICIFIILLGGYHYNYNDKLPPR